VSGGWNNDKIFDEICGIAGVLSGMLWNEKGGNHGIDLPADHDPDALGARALGTE
jgi:hypothetical protein